MGRIMRKYARFHKATISKGIVAGTYAAPVTQVEAEQILISAFVSAVALGGEVMGGYVGVVASTVDLTGNLTGFRARVAVTDITLTGRVYGAQIQASVYGAGVISSVFEGLHISLHTDAGVTMSGSMRGLYISGFCAVAHATYEMLRLEENGACTVTAMIGCYVGAGAITYFLILSSTENAWNNTGDKTGGHTTEAGWIKVCVNGYDKYIQLYDG